MGVMQALSLGGLSPKELLRRAAREAGKDDCTAYAAAVAYYFLYALFPFFIFLTALLPYLPIPNLLDTIMNSLAHMLPREALGVIEDNIRKLVTERKGGLLSFGIALALWTSSSSVVAFMNALNRAYGVEETRSFVKLRLTAILLVIGFSLFIVTSIVLLIFGPKIGAAVAAKVGMGSLFTTVWNILRWPVILVLMSIALSGLYYFAPDLKQSWRWITPGAVVVIVAWLAVSLGFSYYVNNFGSYDKTYGSLGAVIVLITWMFVTALIILFGGEINSEIAKEEERRENLS